MRNSIENQHSETVLARYVMSVYFLPEEENVRSSYIHVIACTVIILYFVVCLSFLLAKLKLTACPVCKRYPLKKAIL
jgi:hypothetical protein